MDKWQAIQSFWSGFGVPAYDEATVPSGGSLPDFPYITYNVQTGAMDDFILLTASIWDRSNSWVRVSNIADQIAEFIGYGYALIEIDDGYVVIRRGAPFAQRMSDEDDSIRRIIITINVEYLSAF